MGLYPRQLEDGTLVSEKEMVTSREHLYQVHRLISLSGQISAETESTDLLLTLDSISHDPIKILITSPGGLLMGTFLFCDTFKLICAPVYTIGRFCASAATLLLASGEPDKRFLFPSASIMLHLPSATLAGDSKDIHIQQSQIQKAQNAIVALLQENGVKKSDEQIVEDIDRDFWMTAQEAIDYGLADHILSPEEMQKEVLNIQ